MPYVTSVVLAQAPNQLDPGDNQAGLQVLTRGPVHEAFAEPVVYDPRASQVIPKAPPALVEELPPDQKPDGDDIQWIPGYWSWDESRDDFLWVSGVWREPPPGRQWVSGYWNQVAGGYQWVPGAWTPIEEQQADYLPQPPASLEIGPNVDAPDQNSIWAPGCWYWQQTRYAWRPGYWVRPYPNWVWTPAHYVWSPSGYLFIDGYWDRPLARRGCLFAPVYFTQPVYAQPRFVYRPTITILATALTTSLFVRPAQCSYYFGDYYDASYSRRGIYPWYAYHQSRYGYDPIYSHHSAIEMRTNPNWNVQIREVYRYRRDHIDARPPHTYVQQTNLIQRNNINVNQINTVVNNTTVNNVTVNNVVNNVVVAQPIRQVAASPQNPVKFVSVDRERRDQFAKRGQEVRAFQQQRQTREVALQKTQGARPNMPQRANMPKSPIVANMQPSVNPNPGPGAGPGANPGAVAKGAQAKAQPQPQPQPHADRRPPSRPNMPKPDAQGVPKMQRSRPEPNPDLVPPGNNPRPNRPQVTPGAPLRKAQTKAAEMQPGTAPFRPKSPDQPKAALPQRKGQAPAQPKKAADPAPAVPATPPRPPAQAGAESGARPGQAHLRQNQRALPASSTHLAANGRSPAEPGKRQETRRTRAADSTQNKQP